ncbi:MAG: hypothetical protein J6Y60_09770, partial [Treponema sp.]|nr:hypothetical protein [Treponema sp.]
MFLEAKNALVFKKGNETMMIEPWGKDSLRVRSTLEPAFIDHDVALTEKINHGNAKISVTENGASIFNGMLEARLNNNGVISFYKNGKLILQEYYRQYDPTATKESCCTKIISRQFQGIIGGDYSLTVRFNPNDEEKLFGMGQYPTPY